MLQCTMSLTHREKEQKHRNYCNSTGRFKSLIAAFNVTDSCQMRTDQKRLTAGYATVGCHEIKSEGPLFNSMVTKHIALLKGRLAVGDL